MSGLVMAEPFDKPSSGGVGKSIYTANSLGALMADPEGTEFQRKVTFSFFAVLFISGLIVYWAWGVLYDTWYPFDRGNIAIYTIYVPLIALGVLGMLLYRKKPVKR